MPIAASNSMGTAPSGAHPLAKAAPSTAHAFIPSAGLLPIALPSRRPSKNRSCAIASLVPGRGGALSSFPPAACGIFTLDLGVHAEYFSGSRNSRERDRDQRDSRSGSGGPERQQGVLGGAPALRHQRLLAPRALEGAAPGLARPAHHARRRPRHQGAAAPQPRAQPRSGARAPARARRARGGRAAATQADPADPELAEKAPRKQDQARTGQEAARQDPLRRRLTNPGSPPAQGRRVYWVLQLLLLLQPLGLSSTIVCASVAPAPAWPRRRQTHPSTPFVPEEAMTRILTRLALAAAVSLPIAATAAEYMEKTPFQLSRAFSTGVITDGGRIVWVAGQTATRDNDGKDIANNFEAQVKQVFSQIDQVLKRAGGSLANVVQMTVFIKESRYGDRFVEMRKDMFQNGNYPGSALITVTNFARPGIEIEIQSVGVIGDRCSGEHPCSAEGQAKKK